MRNLPDKNCRASRVRSSNEARVMGTQLINLPMVDGSRHFARILQTVLGQELRDHLAHLRGLRISGFAAESGGDVWIDFQFRGQEFSVHNHRREYWFFVDDPSCSEATLQRIVRHVDALVFRR